GVREVRSADRVVVTLPLGVLKAGEVQFLPDLPVNKAMAVDQLGNGRLEKLFLRFEEVFWGDAEVLVHLGTERGTWFHWYAGQNVLGAPILVSRNGGGAADLLAEMVETEVVQTAIASLRETFKKVTV